MTRLIRRQTLAVFTLLLAGALASSLGAQQVQVSYERILRAAQEPQNWLTYNGSYASNRYSTLTQINPATVKNLELKWLLPNRVFGPWQATPLVVDGIMYLTQRPNDIIAMDAKT